MSRSGHTKHCEGVTLASVSLCHHFSPEQRPSELFPADRRHLAWKLSNIWSWALQKEQRVEKVEQNTHRQSDMSGINWRAAEDEQMEGDRKSRRSRRRRRRRRRASPTSTLGASEESKHVSTQLYYSCVEQTGLTLRGRTSSVQRTGRDL